MKTGKIMKTGLLVTGFIAIQSFSTLAMAQDGTAQDMNQHANHSSAVASSGAPVRGQTVDTELAQKMFRRGNTYSNLERYEEAIEEYRKAIAADPNFAEAIRNLANTYYFTEQFSEAKSLLKRYIDLETTTTAALIASISTLAELERRDKNYTESIKYDLRSIELDPSNDSQVHVMANTYNNAGDADKAIQVYQAGIVQMPQNAFFDRSLGRILEQQGRDQEALAAYTAAAEKDPDSDFYQGLVDTLSAKLNR